MSSQTDNDFEGFCKAQIAYLDSDVEYKKSQHEGKVNFNKEHADEIMDELRTYGSWMSNEEPTPEHWYSTEQDDLRAIYRREALAGKWRTVLQGVMNHASQLDLSNMEIESFPLGLCNLTNLTALDLSGNELSILPKEISNLVNLTSLNLSNNRLATLPVEVGQLKNLVLLDLKGNPLSTIPWEIKQLTKLQSLKV